METSISQHKDSKYKSILHLDKLIITLLIGASTYFPISGYTLQEDFLQSFDEVTISYNKYHHNNGYLLTFDVLFCGEKVGILRSSEKYHKPYVEFEFSKHVFYSKHPLYWYEIFLVIQNELLLGFNNVRYVEIALDSTKDFPTHFRKIINNSSWNKSCSDPRYEKVYKKSLITSIENESFNAGTSGNIVAIYNKSLKTEPFIEDYHELNGFGNKNVFRLEARLQHNYLRSLKNKGIAMDLSILADPKQLAYLFKEVTKNRVTFKDLNTKHWDNRNDQYDNISLLENIDFNEGLINNYVPSKMQGHYKTDDSSMVIIKRMYYQYLVFGNLNLLVRIYDYSNTNKGDLLPLPELLTQLDNKFNGNRTEEVIKRMKMSKMNIWSIKKQITLERLNRSIFSLIKRLTMPVEIVGEIEWTE